MSDGGLRASIDQMEVWVADPSWEPDPEALVRWDADFQTALAQEEKGPDWLDLMARAHAVGHRLQARTVQFAQVRDELRAQLDAQERGNRALKGYRASVR
jgi:hypothetical protein